MLWSLAAAAILAIASGSAVPADAAKKRNKATDGSQASRNNYADSVDLSYVAGHGSPSSVSTTQPRKPGKKLKARKR
jgi:hypothetical protein